MRYCCTSWINLHKNKLNQLISNTCLPLYRLSPTSRCSVPWAATGERYRIKESWLQAENSSICTLSPFLGVGPLPSLTIFLLSPPSSVICIALPLRFATAASCDQFIDGALLYILDNIFMRSSLTRITRSLFKCYNRLHYLPLSQGVEGGLAIPRLPSCFRSSGQRPNSKMGQKINIKEHSFFFGCQEYCKFHFIFFKK